MTLKSMIPGNFDNHTTFLLMKNKIFVEKMTHKVQNKEVT